MTNGLALVIGNANYVQEKDKLINAVNDARDFGNKLLTLGFTIQSVFDCDGETFDREVRKFGENLKKYDVGLFYFSGHGLQIEGLNYLTAVDTSFADDTSAKHTSYKLDRIIEYMQKANPIVKILILDACRDNPLPSIYRGVGETGLAPIYAPKGTIIAFSTSPGEKALDYGSENNSIYTGALLNHIDDTNIPIEDFFKRVRTSVYTLTNGKQTSWEHTSLIGNFCFNSGQLVHSVDLPYKKEHIADENFEPDGSEIDDIIVGLRSHTWPIQQSAIKKVRLLKTRSVSESSLFILGRNLLQSAEGGEFSANSIFNNLGTWLLETFPEQYVDVLNGILFEIYFNSKGQFRQVDFKCSHLEEVFKLQANAKFKKSFDFIRKQLEPFKDYLFYLPDDTPTALPIEVKFEEKKSAFLDNSSAYKLTSIKHSEIELLIDKEDLHPISVDYDSFIEKLCQELCIPKNQLRISTNIDKSHLKEIHMPWQMRLSKRKENR